MWRLKFVSESQTGWPGHTAFFTEGKIILGRGNADDHVWVEVPIDNTGSYIIDLTSDQYATPFGTKWHVGSYDVDTPVQYVPEQRWDPYDLPHRKLKARYAILEKRIKAQEAHPLLWRVQRQLATLIKVS